MARIAGIDLPREKRGLIAVQYIYGIGIPSATRIMADARCTFDEVVAAGSVDKPLELPAQWVERHPPL